MRCNSLGRAPSAVAGAVFEHEVLKTPQGPCTNWGPAPLGKERRSQGCTGEQWRCHNGDCVKAEYR